jgi:hypothetical protein
MPRRRCSGLSDEEQPAERPEGLPAQVGAVLLVEDQHPQAALDEFAGGHQARQFGADDDRVGAELAGRGIAHAGSG